MFIFDSTTLAFARKAETMVKEILNSKGITVQRSRFLYANYLYPIRVVVFEGPEWGHFSSAFLQIGLNKKLIYQAKDSVVRDILGHELAHYLTWIKFGAVSAHGPEFKQTCAELGFASEIAQASLNLEQANLDKEGDLAAERVIEKVKKLFQLAQSSNLHEAELATLKANSLLLRHNLEHTKQDHDEAPLFMERVMEQKQKDAKLSAMAEMLRHFMVRPVMSFGQGRCCLEITGTKTNLKLALYVVDFLQREMDLLWAEARKTHQLSGKRAKNSFWLGLAKGFSHKMEEQKSQYNSEDSRALVVLEKNLDRQIHQIYGRLSSAGRSSELDAKAQDLGHKQGQKLSIRPGVESSLSGKYLGWNKN